MCLTTTGELGRLRVRSSSDTYDPSSSVIANPSYVLRPAADLGGARLRALADPADEGCPAGLQRSLRCRTDQPVDLEQLGGAPRQHHTDQNFNPIPG